jgi:hypothetical protein
MSEIFVKHTLNPRKAIKFILNLRKYALKETEGELVWLLEIGTTEPAYDGKVIPPKFIHNVKENNIEAEINKAVASMCSLVNWESLDIDRYSPVLSNFSPVGNDVPITSRVHFTIVEDSPASGIDLSGMTVTLNNGDVDFDITPEVIVTGDPYEYNIQWIPEILYR